MPSLPTPAAPGSDRVRLARLALDAALAVPGVQGVDAGPRARHVTVSGTNVIRGVLVAAEPGGRYSVDLGLCARLVSLPALADAIRARVARNVQLAGSADQLGAIGVTFHDIVEDAPSAPATLGAGA